MTFLNIFLKVQEQKFIIMTNSVDFEAAARTIDHLAPFADIVVPGHDSNTKGAINSAPESQTHNSPHNRGNSSRPHSPHTNSGAIASVPAIFAITGCAGLRRNRLAESNTSGSRLMSPAVFRNTVGLLNTQCTARSIVF